MKRVVFVVLIALIGVGSFVGLAARRRASRTEPEPQPHRLSSLEPGRAASAPAGSVRVLRDADPRGSLRLEGLVVGLDELPVVGATVVVDSYPPAIVTTGADGSFGLDGLFDKRYTVVARHQASAAGPVTVRLTATSDPLILRLAPAAVIAVTVVEASDKRPLPDATVELRGLWTQREQAGADGVARFVGVPPGVYPIAAWAPGHGLTHASARVRGGGDERVAIELRAGAPVTGRVVTRDGAAVAGATVLYAGASDWSQQADPLHDQVTSDAAGRFEFAGLPADTYRFIAYHDDFAPGQSALITLDGVTRRTDVEIVAEPGHTITGKVVSSSGATVEGAEVRLAVRAEGLSLEPVRQTTTDAAGAFRFTGVPASRLDVAATHEGAASEILAIDAVASGAPREVVLTLDVEDGIGGTVVDAQGEPVAGAQVSVWRDVGNDPDARREWELRGVLRDLTDAGGAFALRGLRKGTYVVAASPPYARDDWQHARKKSRASVGDKQLRLVVDMDGTIEGELAFADGTRPPLFTVSLGVGAATSVMPADGAFRLEDVPPRTYALTVSGPGFAPKRLPGVKVLPGQTTKLGVIQVKRGRTISGRVVTPDGQPIADASVIAGRVLFGDGSHARAGGFGAPGTAFTTDGRTRGNGEFTLYGVGKGDLSIVAEHDVVGRSTAVRIPGSSESVTGLVLVLRPFGVLEGIVTKGGRPAPGVIVNVNSQAVSGTLFGVATGADGRFRFDRLAPDTYLVSATTAQQGAASMGLHTSVVKVSSGETSSVALTIESGEVALQVTLATRDGGPVGFAYVRLVAGVVDATTARKLDDAIVSLGGVFTSMAMAAPGKPAKFTGLRPAGYTVCATAYPAEVRTMSDMFAYFEREGDDLPVVCTQVTVAESPTQQAMELAVTIPAFVAESDSQDDQPPKGDQQKD